MKITLYLFIVILFSTACKKNSVVTENVDIPVPEPIPVHDTLEVKYATNITWKDEQQNLHMDIYVPDGTTRESKLPFVLMIHPGGFTDGDKDSMAVICRNLADSGFIAATLEYRLGWNVKTGGCTGDTVSNKKAVYRALQDANAALRFVVANAGIFAVDTNWIFVGGKSAGAVTAINMNYINETEATSIFSTFYNELGSLTASGNSLTNTFKIKGIASMWGAIVDSTLITGENAVPTIFYHGDKDNVVPVDIGTYNSCANTGLLFGSLCMDRRLRNIGVPSIVNIYPGAKHGPGAFDDIFLSQNIACFFHKIIQGKQIQSKYYSGAVNSCN